MLADVFPFLCVLLVCAFSVATRRRPRETAPMLPPPLPASPYRTAGVCDGIAEPLPPPTPTAVPRPADPPPASNVVLVPVPTGMPLAVVGTAMLMTAATFLCIRAVRRRERAKAWAAHSRANLRKIRSSRT